MCDLHVLTLGHGRGRAAAAPVPAKAAVVVIVVVEGLYSVVQKNSCMFKFPAFLPPTNLGLPMHSPRALAEPVSLNLARFFCSTLYMLIVLQLREANHGAEGGLASAMVRNY